MPHPPPPVNILVNIEVNIWRDMEEGPFNPCRGFYALAD